MAWANLEPGFRALIERVCTEAEVEVLKRVADGAGYKTLARELGITREAERDRWRAADRKIRQEVGTRAERETPGCAMAMARRRAGGAEIGEVRHTRLDRMSRPLIGYKLGKEAIVPTFVVLLNWTEQGIKKYKDSPSRADAFAGVMEKLGGKLKETYWTLGPYDVVGVVEAPDEESVTAAMLELGSRGHTRSTTMRAYTRSEFEGVAAKTG